MSLLSLGGALTPYPFSAVIRAGTKAAEGVSDTDLAKRARVSGQRGSGQTVGFYPGGGALMGVTWGNTGSLPGRGLWLWGVALAVAEAGAPQLQPNPLPAPHPSSRS